MATIAGLMEEEGIHRQPVVTTATEAGKGYVLGIGSRAGVSKEQVQAVVLDAVKAAGVLLSEVREAATVSRKCGEPGIILALEEFGIPLSRVLESRIAALAGAFKETAASRHLGIPAVAEPCAILTARDGEIVLPVQSFNGVTVAIARAVDLRRGLERCSNVVTIYRERTLPFGSKITATPGNVKPAPLPPAGLQAATNTELSYARAAR